MFYTENEKKFNYKKNINMSVKLDLKPNLLGGFKFETDRKDRLKGDVELPGVDGDDSSLEVENEPVAQQEVEIEEMTSTITSSTTNSKHGLSRPSRRHSVCP